MSDVTRWLHKLQTMLVLTLVIDIMSLRLDDIKCFP